MAKQAVTNYPKRVPHSTRKSIVDLPFTKEEIKEMEAIQEKPYWARKPLKEVFCEKNNRMVKEVDEYFKTHRKAPIGGGQRGKKRDDFVIDKSGSTLPNKEQVTQPEQTSFAKLSPTGEIRIKYKSLRIEGGEIIFEV